jgi:hypothetical protein
MGQDAQMKFSVICRRLHNNCSLDNMKHTYNYFPTVGWRAFTDTAPLMDTLWMCYDQSNWHYLNLTAGTSIWESKLDGSVVYIAYKLPFIEQLFAESGQAELTFDPIATQFKLQKSERL